MIRVTVSGAYPHRFHYSIDFLISIRHCENVSTCFLVLRVSALAFLSLHFLFISIFSSPCSPPPPTLFYYSKPLPSLSLILSHLLIAFSSLPPIIIRILLRLLGKRFESDL